MLNFKTLSAASLTLMIAGTAAAGDRGLDVDKKEISRAFNKTLEIDKSKQLEIDKSSRVDYDLKVSDSYTTKTEVSKSVFANPVATGTLHATVTKNSVKAGGFGGLKQGADQGGAASISNGSLSGLKGINTVNVNGGVNAVQQANVSISVVNTSY